MTLLTLVLAAFVARHLGQAVAADAAVTFATLYKKPAVRLLQVLRPVTFGRRNFTGGRADA